MNVLFFLPSRGGGGGAHSIVQECIGMRRFGVQATIAVTPAAVSAFRGHYPELDEKGIRVVAAGDAAELAKHLSGKDIAAATTYASVAVMKSALDQCAGKKPQAAYYVQDYEPLFCSPGTAAWDTARASYTAIPDAILFAKTQWLCDVVKANTGATVNKISASIDHTVYSPGLRDRSDRISVCAMIRPKTRRRAPRRHARIIESLIAEYGDRIDVMVFGCSPAELAEAGIVLPAKVVNRGPLSRREVAAVLRATDVFMDLSDYQAFGRTGLEAMATGCIPLLPVFGGTDEYARHWRNAILVDTRSDKSILDGFRVYTELNPARREAMRMAAIGTALEYTPEKAAFSEISLFSSAVGSA